VTYAANTNVPVSKSRAEIEHLLTRHGATRFASMSESGRGVIMFEAEGRRVMFSLPLPKREEFAQRLKHGRMQPASPDWTDAAHEQACRSRWRSLALIIKAKLEAVDSGVSTFQDEFLAFIVLPGGDTVGSYVAAQIEAIYQGGMPTMLQLGAGR